MVVQPVFKECVVKCGVLNTERRTLWDIFAENEVTCMPKHVLWGKLDERPIAAKKDRED